MSRLDTYAYRNYVNQMQTEQQSLLALRFIDLREALYRQVREAFIATERHNCVFTALHQQNIKLECHTTQPETGKPWKRSVTIVLTAAAPTHQSNDLTTLVDVDFAEGAPTTTLVAAEETVTHLQWTVPHNEKGDSRMDDLALGLVTFLKNGHLPLPF